MTLPILDLSDVAIASKLQGRSLAIAAGAGSGKTFTLVTLVLGFLGRDDARPFHVMATTFGKDAAAELKSRLLAPLDQLAAWDLATWSQAREALLQGFDVWDPWMRASGSRGEIALAARQWRNEEGAWPAWMSSAKSARRHWIRQRREAELMNVGTVHSAALQILSEGDQAGRGLVESTDPRLLRLLRRAGRSAWDLPADHPDHLPARQLLAWAESANHWTALAEGFDAFLDGLGAWQEQASTASIAQSFWREAQALVKAYEPFATHPMRAAKQTSTGAAHKSFDPQKMPTALVDLDSPIALFRWLESFGALVNVEKGSFKNHTSDAFHAAMFSRIKELPDRWETWITLLIEQGFRTFEKLKAERALLSYGDLTRRALDALKQAPLLHPPQLLLVDEYQDINPVQEAFLNAIQARFTVVVGDKKQAIYGFRGGVSALLDARLKNAASGEAFRLPMNHRSSAPVVETANAYVRSVVPIVAPESADEDGEQAHGGKGLGECRVAIAMIPSSKKGSDLPSASPWIAALSREKGWRDAGFAAPLKEGLRRRTLLLDRRTGLSELRRSLQAQGVEPLVQSGDGFWQSPTVRLMMALLECLAHPERLRPLMSVLRSPWIGATDAQLQELSPSLAQGLLEMDPAAFPSALREGVSWLLMLRKQSAQAIVGQAITRPGLFHFVASLSAHGRLEPTRALRNLDQWLGWIPELPAHPAIAFARLEERRRKTLGDALAEDGDADLLIQTIHASKGLEYEDVLLPMLKRRPRGLQQGHLGVDDRKHLRVAWKLGATQGPSWIAMKVEEKTRAFREGLNLLYVGLTRAKDRLVLLKQDDIEALKRPQDLQWSELANQLMVEAKLPRLDKIPSFEASVLEKKILIPEPKHIRLEAPALESIASDHAAREARRRRGIQIHALLREVLIRDAEDEISAMDHLIAAPLLQTWKGAERVVRTFMEALRAKGWSHLPRRTEFALEGAAVSSASTGYADLVIWEPDRDQPNAIHLIDFKWAAVFSEEELARHTQQLRGYRKVLARLYPGVPIDAQLFALESAAWVQLEG
jgi:ATP-dependent exoDNAse (exonuclease V) beta subunit